MNVVDIWASLGRSHVLTVDNPFIPCLEATDSVSLHKFSGT